MPITGMVEEVGQFGIRGWLVRDTPARFAPLVDVVVNRRLAATVSSVQSEPSHYRFSFNPFESLKLGLNSVEVFVSGTDQVIENGVGSIVLEPATRPGAEVELPAISSEGELVFGPGICEHCFPSVAGTLARVYRELQPGGVAVLDFLCPEPGMTSSYATLDGDGIFTRMYSEPELRSFVLNAGLEILEIKPSAQYRAQLRAMKPEVNF